MGVRIWYRLSLIILLWLSLSGRLACTKADSFLEVLLSVVEPQAFNSLTVGVYDGSPRRTPFHFYRRALRHPGGTRNNRKLVTPLQTL